jgi:hypothetical protein
MELPPPRPSNPAKALIYAFRPQTHMNKANVPPITFLIDDVDYELRLFAFTYVYMEIDPGRRNFKMKGLAGPVIEKEMDLEAGQTYYCWPEVASFTTHQISFVDETEGLKFRAVCRMHGGGCEEDGRPNQKFCTIS